MKTWRLDCGAATLVLASDGGMASAIHWGARLPDTEDLAQLAASQRPDLTGGSLDATAPLSICPAIGQPGIVLRDCLPVWSYSADEHSEEALALHFTDDALGLRYTARFRAHADLFEMSATLDCDTPRRLDWLAAPVLPGPQGGDIHTWHGRWLGEFRRRTAPWQPGAFSVEARTGRSGHDHPPYALLREGAQVWALHLAWSGGHRFVAEEGADGRRQLQMGAAPRGELGPLTTYTTPPLLAAYSAEGEAGIAVAFQRHIRDHVVPWPDPDRPRPVHYNCWEAVYFDHSLPRLTAIADRAAALGAERFVLDDGWFGRRDDDTTSLGDWQVDSRKWPDGLTPLIAHVQSLGMTFGLWVEPEMVNEDSDLFRAHPDWRLGPADQIPGRGQYVLDMARDDVRDHLFAVLDALLADHAIDYLKWDHNRTLPVVDAAQTRGLYDLLDRLRLAHPGVEIESCASGGGRIDAGILARTHRVWLSDSNDALERLAIQHEAALFLPAAITGSHVGPRHCHTSGRVLPMAFRAWVAAQRHMGFEMDPVELTPDEAATLTRVTAWWKDNRDWTMRADVLPLATDDRAVIAEVQIARDGARFVAFAGQAAASAQTLPRPLRLTGLNPAARYRVTLANPQDIAPQSRGPVALKDGPLILSGTALMTAGFALPWAWPATMWVLEGERL